MIDLDELLYGNPVWSEVVKFFKEGAFDEEHHEVAAIKRHLRTPEQKSWMHDNDISIEDMLNGRVEGFEAQRDTHVIFGEWNGKLGFTRYGY